MLLVAMVQKKTDYRKCPDCGFGNPTGGKFCSNCGKKLTSTTAFKKKHNFEGLYLLHLTGGVYVLVSMILNELIKVTFLLLIPYLMTGLLSLYAAYRFRNFNPKNKGMTKLISLTAIILGFVATFALFFLGLSLSGAIGPAWIIFLITGIQLWYDRKTLK